jgi:hypothetical protein
MDDEPYKAVAAHAMQITANPLPTNKIILRFLRIIV